MQLLIQNGRIFQKLFTQKLLGLNDKNKLKKTTKYHTVRTFSKSNRKLVETEVTLIPLIISYPSGFAKIFQ